MGGVKALKLQAGKQDDSKKQAATTEGLGGRLAIP